MNKETVLDKRSLLIHAAFELFYQKGVNAVGINEVLKVSGVAKKTLYHHFASKEELVLAVLQYRDDIFTAWLTSRLEAAATGTDKVVALFQALDDWFHNRVPQLKPFHGCFFINVGGEYANADHPLHQQCARHKDRIAALIRTQLEAWVEDPAQVGFLTEALCLLKEGAITQAHLHGDLAAAKKASKVALALF